MKPRLNGLVLLITLIYPFAVLVGLRRLEQPAKVFPVALGVIILLNLLANIPAIRKRDFKVLARIGGMIFAGAFVVALIIITENAGYAKLYPVIVNIALFGFFGISVLRPPTVIWRFAVMKEPELEESENRKYAEKYCRNVTLVWCAFFLVNAGISLSMSLLASDAVWTLYNGFISYMLIGILFGIEILVRRKMRIGA